MAQVRLDRDEASGSLPRVCMRCGADAVTVRQKNFSWHPQWISTLIIVGLLCFTPLLLAGVILALVMTKRMRVHVPFCEAHRNYFLSRGVYIYGGLALFFVLGAGALALVIAVNEPGNSAMQDASGYLCLGLGALGFVWLISAAIVQNVMIRATEITDDSITLTKVSAEFEKALRDERRDEAWDDERPPRPRRARQDRGEFFDPKQPPEEPPDAYRRRDD